MTTKRAAGGEREGLRERVLAASRALIDEQGLAALSMREVARRAGVSHQAPYNHFADREAILAALAEEGFHALAARFRDALTLPSACGAVARSLAIGRAYIAFALEQPAHFRVMFRPELVDLSRCDAARGASDSAFAYLHASIGELMGEGIFPGASVEGVAAMMWSMVHGFACLALDGPFSHNFQTDVASLADIATAQLARLLDASRPKG